MSEDDIEMKMSIAKKQQQQQKTNKKTHQTTTPTTTTTKPNKQKQTNKLTNKQTNSSHIVFAHYFFIPVSSAPLLCNLSSLCFT